MYLPRYVNFTEIHLCEYIYITNKYCRNSSNKLFETGSRFEWGLNQLESIYKRVRINSAANKLISQTNKEIKIY